MKRYDTVLFDLDGTLLPMDQDLFVKEYFKDLCAHTARRGYKPDELVKAVWRGTGAMVGNDGSKTNEQAFWAEFSAVYGDKAYEDKPLFDDFYENAFDPLIRVCRPDKRPSDFIKVLKSRGIRLIIASNPIFPLTAHKKRLVWSGLDPDDFAYITSYENSAWCKPSPGYYTEIAEKNGLDPGKCLMVGNDVSEDTPAALAGMDVFIITDCLINKNNTDLGHVPHGDMDALVSYLEKTTKE